MEKDYRAIIAAAEERARLSAEAWVAEQHFEYGSDDEDDQMEENTRANEDLRNSPFTQMMDLFFFGKDRT